MNQRLNIKRPSTLLLKKAHSRANYVQMRDDRGRVTYFRHLKGTPDNFSVNIPRSGSYFLEGDFFITDLLPLHHERPKFTLPPAERNKFKPFNIEINPNLKGTPARIFTDVGKVEIGQNFKQYPPQIRLFILLHELGHFYYITEWKADLFAAYWYINLGYNASNAFYALSKVLSHSPANTERLQKLFNQITK